MNTTTVNISRADVIRALSERITEHNVSRAKWIVAALIVLAAGFIGAKYATTWAAVPHSKVEPPTHNPSVSVAHPGRPQKQLELQLPAEAEPYQTTTLYSRIRGFLQRWNVDRGERVKAGQVLAQIDAPEFDQQLLQSEADLKQGFAQLQQTRTERDQAMANVASAKAQVERAEASLKLAQMTAVRFKNLVALSAASQQQYDETMTNVDTTKAVLSAANADVLSKEAAVATNEAAINTAEARVNSLQASVRRLKELEAFKRIVAPFDGTITRRFVDAGALIPDDGSKPLFTIIQDHVLRIQVNVPQTYAQEMREGNSARVIVRELGHRELTAKIARTARAIDPGSRTLTVELELANADGAVISGSFVQVKFELSMEAQPLAIPASTLKMTKEGPMVALVGEQGRIHFQHITLGRDHGATIEVASGLNGGEALVINPAENLTEGVAVDVPGATVEVAGK
jgi:HlyD family secretion protein